MPGRTLFVFPGRSRAERLPGVATGDVPREFFYGYLALRDAGYDVAFADSHRDPGTLLGRGLLHLEIRRNSLVNLGYSSQRVQALASQLNSADLALSFTDGFSISLGLYGHRLSNRPWLAGGFHGLADTVDLVRPIFHQRAHRIIRRAVAGLDHLFFSGEPDRRQSVALFGLDPAKTSLYRFGVDTEFWCPDTDASEEDVILAVGSDPKRDYATLIGAKLAAPVRIVTRLPVVRPSERHNLEVIRGSYHGSPVTDRALRDMYRRARVVVVPLRDVWQPTGCSVTLQAMACGRPVVLSDIRGLWDRETLRNDVNCLLVPPGDPSALAAAIDRLRSNPALRHRIGAAARETAISQFPIRRMNQDVVALAERVGVRSAERAPHLAVTS